eukprot:13028275-Heterocapsa_arctica.AAC.1
MAFHTAGPQHGALMGTRPAHPAAPAWVDPRLPNPIPRRGADASRSPRQQHQATWADRQPVWPHRPYDVPP